MEILLLLGAPGSGKGTIAARIAAQRSFTVVSSGDILREAVARKTALGLEAQGFMRSGALVPDALVGRMITDVLTAGAPDARYLLDGFPRTVPQLELLEKDLAARGGAISAAILLEVSDALVMARLGGRRVCPACQTIYHVATLPPRSAGICDACGGALTQRNDDQPATIAKRLAVYHQQTKPVIAACAARGLLRRVDGVGGVDEIVARALQALTA